MTSIAQITKTTVKRTKGALARKNFGVGLLLYPHTKTANRVISITGPDELAGYGFSTSTDKILYDTVTLLFSQAVKPAMLKIGRQTTAPIQSFTITVGAALTVGQVIRWTLNGVERTHTVVTATPTAVGTAIAASMLADEPTATIASVTGVITFTNVAGKFSRLSGWSKVLQFKTIGAGVAIDTDLDAIWAEDPNWTGFDAVFLNEPESKLCAAWAEAKPVLFLPTLHDFEMRDSVVTTDAASDLKALSYTHTAVAYSGKSNYAHSLFAAFVWLGAQTAPGGETFAHKSLVGVLADDDETLNSAELDTLVVSKNVNVYYQKFEDRAILWEGKTIGGGWIDIERGLLWAQYDLNISSFEAINNRPDKLPFTQEGSDVLLAAAKASIDRGVTSGLWDPDRPAVFTVTPIKNVTSADRSARVFPPITITAYLAGAIHATSFVLEVQD